MKRFFPGQPVKFKSEASAHVFHGQVVRRCGSEHYVVEDQSGLPARPVRAVRLELDVEGVCFTPKVAA
jgi:hypothetical protein